VDHSSNDGLIRERNPRARSAASTARRQLIDWAYAKATNSRWRVYRPSSSSIECRQGSGIAHSLHTQRLAVDLQLFKDAPT